jgi:small conductance mechanosensitive channel
MLRYLKRVVVTLAPAVLLLSELRCRSRRSFGAAGARGAGGGVPSAKLVKDCFTGFFILVENRLTAGDVVNVADKAGLVEGDMTLRFVPASITTDVHLIPDNLITDGQRTLCD